MFIEDKYFHYTAKRFQCLRHAQLVLAQFDGDQHVAGDKE